MQYVTTQNIIGGDGDVNNFTARLCGGCLYDKHMAVVSLNMPKQEWSEFTGDVLTVTVKDMHLKTIATNIRNGKLMQDFNFTYYASYGDLSFVVKNGAAPGFTYTITLRFISNDVHPLKTCNPRWQMSAYESTLERRFYSIHSQKGKTYNLVPIFKIEQVSSVPSAKLAFFKLDYCFADHPPYNLTITTVAADHKSGFATYACPKTIRPCNVNTKFRDTSGSALNFIQAHISGPEDFGSVEVIVRGDGRYQKENKFTLAASTYYEVPK